MEDGVNFLVYKRRNLNEEQEKRASQVKLGPVIQQLVSSFGHGGRVVTKKEQVVVIYNTTNYVGAKLKSVIGELFTIETFVGDHPLVNGIESKPMY
jgi:hypothetical protein